MITRQSCPSALRDFGSAPATSARPPTFANGATSAEARRILRLLSELRGFINALFHKVSCFLKRELQSHVAAPPRPRASGMPSLAAVFFEARPARGLQACAFD